MSLMASLVTTSRMEQWFGVPIDSYHEFLLLFCCCVLLEIKLTTTTTTTTLSTVDRRYITICLLATYYQRQLTHDNRLIFVRRHAKFAIFMWRYVFINTCVVYSRSNKTYFWRIANASLVHKHLYKNKTSQFRFKIFRYGPWIYACLQSNMFNIYVTVRYIFAW